VALYNLWSTDIQHNRINRFMASGAYVQVPALSCRSCLSVDIGSYLFACVKCYQRTLWFDDVRFEIVCTECGLVHAGTSPNGKYPFGFLVKRPR